MGKIYRDFEARTELEKGWILENTWCDECDEADLGMTAPREYEEDGRIYVEGRCPRCGQRICSEIAVKDAG